MRVLLLLGIVSALSGVTQASAASPHRYRCYAPGLCLGASFRKAAAHYQRQGYKPIKRLQPLICRFYRPVGSRPAERPCLVLRKKSNQLFLVGHHDRLVFAYIGISGKATSVATLRKRWGNETQQLRSLEGLNLFWTATDRKIPFGLGAFLPYIPGSKKKIAALRPKGVFLFHMRGLKDSPYASSFAVILRIARHIQRHNHWPRHCFHTLCLGSPQAATLALLKSQGYQVDAKRPFRGCQKTFASPSIPANKLRCLVLVRSTSSTYLRMVWGDDRLLFVQGERLSPAPNVRTLRWVWGPETRKHWLRGMLFVQWFKPTRGRYLLSVPLYGDKQSKKPLDIRRSVGFVLLDWKHIGTSKMGQALKKFLNLPATFAK